MWPVKLSSASASMNGSEATSTQATPPTHAASRQSTGRGWASHAAP